MAVIRVHSQAARA